MTAAALTRFGRSDHHPHGWLASFVVHGIALSIAVLLFSEIRPSVQIEPFHWEIALTQVSSPSKVEPPSPAPPRPRHIVQPPPTPSKPIETKPVVQRVETVQTVQKVEQIVRQEQVAVQEINPVVESMAQHAEAVYQETSRAVDTPAPSQIVPTEVSAVNSQVAPSVKQETVLTRSAPEATQQPVTTQQSVIETARSEDTTPSVQQIAHAAATQSQAVERPAPVTSSTKADYSWLAQELLSRLEQSKRYPYTARMNRWEGKVVVKAIVRDDGQVISLQIAETSGHTVLDNDAMELIKQVSPIHMKHPLGQSQVALLVPVGYSLH